MNAKLINRESAQVDQTFSQKLWQKICGAFGLKAPLYIII